MPLPSSNIVNFDATKRAELMLKLHETTKQNIERMNAKYKLAVVLTPFLDAYLGSVGCGSVR